MTDNIIVPVKLDAFVLNASVVSSGPSTSRIAPITQPNYAALRPNPFDIQHDLLQDLDVRYAKDPSTNPRVTDIANGLPRLNRLGVYLHWMLPRVYRIAVNATPSAETGKEGFNAKARKKGFRNSLQSSNGPDDKDAQAPQYRQVPNRWLIVRWIPDKTTILPVDAKDKVPEFQAFLIESDRCQGIGDLEDDVDAEVEAAPFVDPSKGLEDQADTAEKKYIPLSVLHSSNHLFADYQPHNSNVFSLVDNFAYEVPVIIDGEPRLVENYLAAATASYFVFGWHSDPELQDVVALASLDEKRAPDQTLTHEKLLQTLMMEIKRSDSPDAKAWLADKVQKERAILHGAMYDVVWSSAAPPSVPANDVAQKLAGSMPIAIGTTALDALLTFVQAHDKPPEPHGPLASRDADPTHLSLQQIEDDILKLQTLLLKQDDGIDAHDEAKDLLHHDHYSRTSGGYIWHFASREGKDVKPHVPSRDEQLAISRMNAMQLLSDACLRQAKLLRWQLFAEWWKYVSQMTSNLEEQDALAKHTKHRVEQLTTVLDTTIAKLKACDDQVSKEGESVKCERGERGVFYKKSEPTMLIAGVASGWPADWADKLRVRTPKQVLEMPTVSGFEAQTALEKIVFDAIGSGPQSEFVGLPRIQPPIFDDTQLPLPGWANPLYHDARLRDQWGNAQPFFPLFVEWEATYLHIPFKDWDVQTYEGQMRYGLNTYVGEGRSSDRRRVGGRNLILPQAGYSLKNSIAQLFKNTNPADLDAATGMSEDERKTLLKSIDDFQYLSFPLTGLTEHLLTLCRGTHVKPTSRQPGRKPTSVAAAVREEAGFTSAVLDRMGAETALTPYGSLVDIDPEATHSPFKPVTHGQLFITKLNIVDKFGQVVSAIDPTPRPPPVDNSPKLYPCVSDTCSCWPLVDPRGKITEVANTVIPDKPGKCAFIQLPPTINQEARLNSVVVVEEEEQDGTPESWPRRKGSWRPAHEWENPIWGWLVVNYADFGVQIFLPDGTFYREVRLGGPRGDSASPAWLPFEPPTTLLQRQRPNAGGKDPPPRTSEFPQLSNLVSKLSSDATYLRGFIDMLSNSLGYTAQTPSLYSEFLPSSIGKPLALINIGYSLELATQPLENQSTLVGDGPSGGPSLVKDYSFPVKLGDGDRTHDGLVGYFTSLDKQKQSHDSMLALDKIYTYFPRIRHAKDDPLVGPPRIDNDPTHTILPSNFPRLRPYHIDPHEDVPANDLLAFERAHTQQLQVFGCLVDPFTPVHAYTAEVLPIAEVEVPKWAVKLALDKMTAFFRVGPLVNPANLPSAFNDKARLRPDYDLTDPAQTTGKGEAGKDDAAVQVPTMPVGEWRWLQPFAVDVEERGEGRAPSRSAARKRKEKKKQKETHFNAFKTAPLDTTLKFTDATGPYTALEGYLQLVKPMTRPGDAPAPEKAGS
ncbi:hypothetical protein H2199_009232 [Coniosporium tulheliwenetii]|uniref:Uncharacterized protein n=1 Tax=Coniosporium tulheliwenetii TaxID=3383036 RepID=A0ACC2YER0_9PEZI|nr:hypothetical protein H2199_009232 [Cladosporium sp. JES 115]